MGELRNAFRNLQGKVKERSHLDARGVNGTIILKGIL
jgi:hypothetical protein